MSKTRYEVYRQQVFDLAATMVVKHSEVADAINSDLIARGYNVFLEMQTGDLNETDFMKTWKYYLNMAGQYHESDTMITIPLADISGPVTTNFTRELLESDPVIAWEYRYGTVFHTDLINRYPDKEILINGILNPVDMDVAISAKDGEILRAGDYIKTIHPIDGRRYFMRPVFETDLAYNNLIEENEEQLLYDLEDWIKGFLRRYHIKDYTLIDDMYLPAMLGILYLYIPMEIMNIRVSYCKTQRAHSYHIREYLESHGQLSQYIQSLSKKQALYLYRNVPWLERNAGKQDTFDDLVHNILTERNLSLFEYVARLDETGFNTLVSDLDNAATGTLPAVDMVREPLNSVDIVGGGSDIRTVRDILNKEIPLAEENDYNLDDVEAEIVEQFVTGNYNELKTKVLESIAVDPSERAYYRLSDVLVNEWIYTSCYGLYTGQVFYTMPNTGRRSSLLAKDALILFLYVFNKGYGNIELDEVPTLGARMIPRLNNIPLQNPLGLPRPSGLPYRPNTKADFSTFVNWDHISYDLVSAIRNIAEVEQYLPSSSDFYDYSRKIHKNMVRRHKQCIGQEHRTTRAMAEYVMVSLYWDIVECELAPPGTLYNDPTPSDGWLEQHAIDFTGMTTTDYQTLADELLLNGTGAGLRSSLKLRDVHRAALQVMRQFTSYTVQFIQTTIDNPIYPSGPQPQRYGDMFTELEGYVTAPMLITEPLDIVGKMKTRDALEKDTRENIIAAYAAFEPDFQAIDANNTLTPDEKVEAFFKAYAIRFSEENINNNRSNSYPDATIFAHDRIDDTSFVSMDTAINVHLRVILPSMRVLEMSSNQEDLLTMLPDNILDGFNYAP